MTMRPKGLRSLLVALAAALAPGCATSPHGGRAGAEKPGPASGEGGNAQAAASGEPGAPAGDAPDALPPTRRVSVGRRRDDTSSHARRSVEEDDAFFSEKVATARAYAAQGEDEAALELLAAALRLEPPAPRDARLRSLRVEIKARRTDVEVLRVDVRGEREFVPFDTDVYLLVRVRNLGTSDVVIRPPEGQGAGATSGSAFVLTITRRDRDIYAAELSRSWTQVVPLVTEGTRELRIPPETAHEVRVRMPAEDAGQAISGVRVLEVGGILRAGRIEAGAGEPLGRVPIRAGRVVVLPGNFEPLALDPLGSMRKAAAATAPVHLVVAAEFVPPAGRAEAAAIVAKALSEGAPELRPACLNALRTLRRGAAGTPLRPLAAPLMDALRARPERSGDVMEGLSAMTGVSLAPDARLWEDWWRRETQGAGSPVPDADEAPRARSPRGRTPPKAR